jgi:hypothetical protein
VAEVRAIATVLGALALAAPAVRETPILDAAVDSFRGRSVFFLFTTDLSPAEIQGLERQIEQEARGPLYIAIPRRRHGARPTARRPASRSN